jgi:hypothetical protein
MVFGSFVIFSSVRSFQCGFLWCFLSVYFEFYRLGSKMSDFRHKNQVIFSNNLRCIGVLLEFIKF